jgi:hypothetical protein
MSHPDPAPLALFAHPRARGTAVRSIAVHTRAQAGELRLEYVTTGDLARVRLPAEERGGRAEGLWRHTCFEAFVGQSGSPGYLELNFSPSGQWAAYRFSGYRQDMTPLALPSPPRIRVRREGERLTLEASVAREALAAQPAWDPNAAAVQLGLAAVVEEDSGTLSYWALGHFGARPDFHDRRAFSAGLPALQVQTR